jgi:hypothetical protein
LVCGRLEYSKAAEEFSISRTDIDEVVAATRRWLEKSVIGLQLCPFAAAVYRANRLRFHVSEARTAEHLLDDLRAELHWLHGADPRGCETTLLIHPWALTDFFEFNAFLGECDQAVAELDLEGILQIASFHPNYQFADTDLTDIGNYTNRSPYPTLHLLREASVERAALSMADPDEIYRNNLRTLHALGHAGWNKLWRE